jgi:ribose 5-phosphate isomerase B
MNILFAADEKTPIAAIIIKWLTDHNHKVALAGHLADEAQVWHWAEIGREVGKKVGEKEFDFGIACCWSGTGVCMAANKESGARAALCWDAETAKLARKWDDANILCLSLRFTSDTVAQEILAAWFSAPFDEETLDQVRFLS